MEEETKLVDELQRIAEGIDAQRQELFSHNNLLSITAKKLNETTSASHKKLEGCLSMLANHLQRLKDENHNLSNIALEIREMIQAIDTKASKTKLLEHQAEAQEELQLFGEKVQESMNHLQELASHLQECMDQAKVDLKVVTQEALLFTTARYKELLITSCTLALFLVTTSNISTYLIMRHFPANVRIIGGKELKILGGNIQVFTEQKEEAVKTKN